METLLTLYLCLAAGGLAQLLFTVVLTWEHRRFHRSRYADADLSGHAPPATLFLPCKGLDVRLESNLRAFFAQRYSQLELCFIVETGDDAAVPVIERLRQEFRHIPSRVIVAGLAHDCGQKVHNLIVATGSLGKQSGILAFADSDASPGPFWLSRLADRLANPKNAIVTGYRWMIPVRRTWANRIVSGLANQLTGIVRLSRFNLVWGGSWAIRVETFRQLALPQAWEGSLNDDLRVSTLARQAGLRVVYDPYCLATSPIEMRFADVLEFIRRQYLQVRVYTPSLWLLTFLAESLSSLSYWMSAVALVFWAVTGGPWWAALIFGLGYYLVNVWTSAIRLHSVRPFLRISDDEFYESARFAMFGGPIISTVAWIGLIASCIGRTLVWRGTRYRLVSPTRTVIESPAPTSCADGSRTGTLPPVAPSADQDAA